MLWVQPASMPASICLAIGTRPTACVLSFIVVLPAFSVKSIDSTGAGDAFIGSFAVFLGEGLPEREAVRRANLYAGLSTTGIGTQKSFYDRARFDAEWAARSKS